MTHPISVEYDQGIRMTRIQMERHHVSLSQQQALDLLEDLETAVEESEADEWDPEPCQLRDEETPEAGMGHASRNAAQLRIAEEEGVDVDQSELAVEVDPDG